MKTTITLTLEEPLSPLDKNALGLLLADAFRAFIASRSGDYVERRYPDEEGYDEAFRRTKRQLNLHRISLAERLIHPSYSHTVTEIEDPTDQPTADEHLDRLLALDSLDDKTNFLLSLLDLPDAGMPAVARLLAAHAGRNPQGLRLYERFLRELVVREEPSLGDLMTMLSYHDELLAGIEENPGD